MKRQNIDGARATARALLAFVKKARDRGSEFNLVGAMLDAMNFEADPKSAKRVVSNALNGDAESDSVLREVIARHVRNGEPLPKPLRSYCLRLLRGETIVKKRGQSPHKNRTRDQLIVLAVKAVIPYGFKPRRSNEDNPSACSIVAEVLAEQGAPMNVEAVEQVWKKRGKN